MEKILEVDRWVPCELRKKQRVNQKITSKILLDRFEGKFFRIELLLPMRNRYNKRTSNEKQPVWTQQNGKVELQAK